MLGETPEIPHTYQKAQANNCTLLSVYKTAQLTSLYLQLSTAPVTQLFLTMSSFSPFLLYIIMVIRFSHVTSDKHFFDFQFPIQDLVKVLDTPTSHLKKFRQFSGPKKVEGFANSFN